MRHGRDRVTALILLELAVRGSWSDDPVTRRRCRAQVWLHLAALYESEGGAEAVTRAALAADRVLPALEGDSGQWVLLVEDPANDIHHVELMVRGSWSGELRQRSRCRARLWEALGTLYDAAGAHDQAERARGEAHAPAWQPRDGNHRPLE